MGTATMTDYGRFPMGIPIDVYSALSMGYISEGEAKKHESLDTSGKVFVDGSEIDDFVGWAKRNGGGMNSDVSRARRRGDSCSLSAGASVGHSGSEIPTDIGALLGREHVVFPSGGNGSLSDVLRACDDGMFGGGDDTEVVGVLDQPDDT